MRLQLHDASHRPDSLVLMLHYCANLKATRYKSTSFNRIGSQQIASCNCSLTITVLLVYDIIYQS